MAGAEVEATAWRGKRRTFKSYPRGRPGGIRGRTWCPPTKRPHAEPRANNAPKMPDIVAWLAQHLLRGTRTTRRRGGLTSGTVGAAVEGALNGT